MPWTTDPAHSQLEFSAKHMGLMTVKGRFIGVTATLDFDEGDFTRSSVEAVIDASTIETGNQMRDGHLKSADFLDVEHYPTLTFKSTSISPAEHDHYRMAGDLTIRGVSRPVSLDVVYSGQGKDPRGTVHAGFSAEGSINRKDWGLTYNAVLESGHVMVGEQVKVFLEVEALKEAAAAVA
ncbi:MAG: YceI family protein [Chloroflexota bacterium]